jgi:hypothetical protein
LRCWSSGGAILKRDQTLCAYFSFNSDGNFGGW